MTRVLFVDDDPMVLKAMSMGIARLRRDWQLLAAASGADALAEVARAHVDAIVTDMRMPTMDGGELLERVRELSPTTRRIVLSGDTHQAGLRRAEAVADEVLAKPCSLKQLAAVVGRAIDRP